MASSPKQKKMVRIETVKQNRGMDINDRVSDYINRAKIKIRSVTMRGDIGGEEKGNKGKGKAVAGNGQGHDGRFTDYIHRMRMKLRTASTVGTGKDVTAK